MRGYTFEPDTSEIHPEREHSNGEEPPTRPKALPFKTFDEITAGGVAKRWIIKNVLARGETSSWFGPPGGTKSSLWTDIAIHVAGQGSWRGYRIKTNTGVA